MQGLEGIRSRSIALFVCAVLCALGGTARAQVTLPANTVIKASDTTYDNKDIIVDGTVTGTATIDGKHAFNSLLVQNGGVVTHDPPSSANFAGGMSLAIAGNCTVTIGSSINGTGKGWAGGNAGSPAQGPGAGGSDTSGTAGGGGAYGGEALGIGNNRGGVPYDDLSLKAPTDLGSGGGSGYSGAYPGGNGGGAIQLTVGGTLQVDGAITADGAPGGNSGAGSGGSLSLTVNTLSGAGSLSASGGAASNGGSGSGGRIAIYYSINSFAPPLTTSGYQIRTNGGYSNNYGTYAGAGTIFLHQTGQTQGDLWIHNSGNNEGAGAYTPLQDALTFDDVYVWGQGVLTSAPGNPLSLNVLGNVTVALDGRINVVGRGYTGGFGPFPAAGPGAGGSDITGGGYGAGGSYGGEGADAFNSSPSRAGAIYDDLTLKAPTDLGSGGGSGISGANPGSNGGGAIQMTVDGTLQLDGQISANGAAAGSGGGGGSGGSIWLTVGVLSGGGAISAIGGLTGGSYYSPMGGSGGGGRIAITYGSNSFASPLSASGFKISSAGGLASSSYGTPTYAGAGTIFLQQVGQTQGDLWVHNAGIVENNGDYTPLADPFTFDDIYVWGQGVLTSAFVNPLSLQVLGTLDIGVDGQLSVSYRGYPGGQGGRLAGGPGAGRSDIRGLFGGAGSYGGVGDSDQSGVNTGGATYGAAAMPTDLGSGGGSGNFGLDAGGSGGGAIHAVVNGTTQIDGRLTADGGYGGGGGAGSGGSVWLVTNTLSGAGLISTLGGGAYLNIFSGWHPGAGGGGRIAIYVAANSFSSGTISAAGGSDGGSGGAAGTVNLYPTSGVSLQSLTLAAATVPEGSYGATTGSITLSGPAPSGGVTIALTTSNLNVASVPPSVTVPAGQQGATFPITPNALARAQSVTIGANLGGQVQSVTLNVLPWIASVTLNPAAVAGGTATTGTVSLNFPAPQGGLPLGLVSGNPTFATPPKGATVAQGKTSVTFNVTTSNTVATEIPIAISATYGPESVAGTLYVDPAGVALKAFSLTPAVLVGGNLSIGTVSLTGRAPAGGAVVALSSANPTLAPIPTLITIPQGKSTAGFVIPTPQVTASQSVVITAVLGTKSIKATLQIQPTGVASVALVPNTVQGGVETALGIVTLQSAVTTSTTVTITSSSTLAVPDATVVIPAGALTATFNVDTNTNSTGKAVKATITATANKISAKGVLTIN